MKVSVIGAGSWGTAVAWLLGDKGLDVTLWAHTQATADAIDADRRNPRYLSDIVLKGVHATSDLAEAVEDTAAVVFVTPSTTVRQMARDLAPHLSSELPVVMLSKGVEMGTGCLLTDILEQELGNAARIAALSGPNHAEEVSRGIPSGTVVASADARCAAFFQDLFMTPRFRVYTSSDVCGVEICAASKNIVAIGNGISVGIGYGDNTTATIITRGLAEMSRLNHALGGEPITCMGLAGMGDLIATCTSVHSRNRTLGTIIAQGGTLEDFTARTHMVAEGATAAKTVTELAQKLGVELPIAEMVRSILWEGGDLSTAADELLSRDPKPEFYGIA